MFFIKIYQIMARRSKKFGSMTAILANFDFSGSPASRLDCEILKKKCADFIENFKRPQQNLRKNALRSWGERGETFLKSI